jgi:multidrug efflux pump subunit AcrB
MSEQYPKGPISWMAQNSVASNLLMFVLIVGGLLVASRVKREVFPEFELDIVQVSVVYPGASPEEVEEGVILSIEDEVRSLDGIKQVTSSSFEGRGIVNIELLRGVDNGNVLQNAKNVVDSIQSFPEEAERPIVSLLERRRNVISLLISGTVDRKILRALAEEIREELIQEEGITLVELKAIPPLEISVEIPAAKLRAYNLRLEQVADLVRLTALDLPGGGVKTPGGEVLLRTKERRDYAEEFKDIAVVSNPDGTQVTLADIAEVKEIFQETDEEAFFNGDPAVRLDVFRIGDQDPLTIAGSVQRFVKEKNRQLPSSVQLTTWDDRSEVYRDRIYLLLKNASIGLILVFLFLGLFLEPVLAFWVTLGIPISIIGSFLFIPWTGVSINMISLFAFIVTLGIVVDDAILVGENVYHKREKGMPYLKASIFGSRQISGPVTFAVLTNIVAFLPLLFVPGPSGKLFMQIPTIVIAVLVVSLVESLYVLPSHLTHEYRLKGFWRWINVPNQVFEGFLKRFIDGVVAPQLRTAMAWRYLTLSCAIGVLLMMLGLLMGGHIKFSYLPRVDSDVVTAQVTLPFGVPMETTRRVQKQLVEGARRALVKAGGEQISRGLYAQIGQPLSARGSSATQLTGSHLAAAQLFLVPSDQRDISGVEFANLWRKEVGEIVGADSTNFQGMIQTGGGQPIDLHLSHPNKDQLDKAAKELAQGLRYYEGVYDIDDGVAKGKPQLSFQVKPDARGLGITSRELAEQVRGAFYGAEALRQQRGRNEIKVMVRLPENERQTLESIEKLIVRTPQGGEIPISEAAYVTFDHSYTSIARTDGRRVQAVTADVDENRANAAQVIEDVEETLLPVLSKKYRGLSYAVEGEQKERLETMEFLAVGFAFAMFGIYALLAIPFKSYTQPLIVMLSIPFGIIGAVLGHFLLGYELSIVSMFGIVALSGVVVNDSLVLIVTANQNLDEGMPIMDAIVDAARRRFRPIVLTSFTTFFGLAPMIFETSMQARFLVPMAISLGFGILFSTFIVLLISASFYLILDDIKRVSGQSSTTGTK